MENFGVYMLYALDYAPGEALLNLLLEWDHVLELTSPGPTSAARRRNGWDSRLDFDMIMWPIWRPFARNCGPSGYSICRRSWLARLPITISTPRRGTGYCPYPAGDTGSAASFRGQAGGLHRDTPKGSIGILEVLPTPALRRRPSFGELHDLTADSTRARFPSPRSSPT
ncbi:MAG: hypothetical protein V8Q30_12940 [Acutalibacteraceae bacterium]